MFDGVKLYNAVPSVIRNGDFKMFKEYCVGFVKRDDQIERST